MTFTLFILSSVLRLTVDNLFLTKRFMRITTYSLVVFMCLFNIGYATPREQGNTNAQESKNFANPSKSSSRSRVFTHLSNGFFISDKGQELVNADLFDGLSMDEEARKLSARLRWISSEEMGTTAMQAIYDHQPNVEKTFHEEASLEKLAKKLQKRFKNYLQVLKTNKITVENLYKFHVKHPITLSLDCCSLPFRELRVDNQYGCRISRLTSCDLIPPDCNRRAFNPGRNLTEVWRGNAQYFPSLKWQYFISTEGIHNEYPSTNFKHVDMHCNNVHDLRHRDVYVATAHPEPKNVLIIIDHGNSLSANQLHIAKAIAKHLLQSLTKNDHVNVLAISSKISFSRLDNCTPHVLSPCTVEARCLYSKFIDGLQKQDKPTNHSLGFLEAFRVIEKTMAVQKGFTGESLVVYISRGLLSSLTDARDVMDTISRFNGKLKYRVVINTYTLIDDGKPIMYEKRFMQDIADQNFSTYDVPTYHENERPRGIMKAVNKTNNLSRSVGKFYMSLNTSHADEPMFTLPYTDLADKGLSLTLSQACYHNEDQIGVVGVDLYMEDIAQDVTYYSKGRGSYAFIIDQSGYTLMHPSLTRPIKTSFQPMHTDIRHFEHLPGFASVREKIIRTEKGDEKLKLRRRINNSTSQMSLRRNVRYVRYIWRKIANTPFIVVIRMLKERTSTRELKTMYVMLHPDLLYHRLDLVSSSTKLCLHLKQLATTERSSVFLSARCFVKPFEHLSQDETKNIVQSYMAYLQDETRLISNPGLNEKVREDVAVLSRINSEWRIRHHASSLNDFIVRRYIATPSGVMYMFPGTLIDQTYDPTAQTWYTRAHAFPGTVTLSAPYLDVGGAGYIITISWTIFEGKSTGSHNRYLDRIVAVMAMDMTMTYFYRLLIDNIPTCDKANIRCFVMDNEGYLIAHPNLIKAYSKGSHDWQIGGAAPEQRHITHTEPLVANDILNHDRFVKKSLCNRYSDRTIQRTYQFNISLDRVLTNLVHGEHCSRYQIAAVPGTNVYLGIVNQTCDMATAFCPCSMVDRLCLNCDRMEQNECECPCECPLKIDFCTGDLLHQEDSNPSCDPPTEQGHLPHVNLSVTLDLHQCYHPNCENRISNVDCAGVVDCEWCQTQADGETPLSVGSYCSSQRVCFGGVVGAHTPYGDEIRMLPEEPGTINTKTTPVGPVAGGIMGCFLVLALGVYCYRHHVHRHSRQYTTTIHENHHRISHEPDDFEFYEDPSSGHTNVVLATFENAATISPYRINTTYRRPAGGDSDHGYSTMTPHEDSEHASLPCLEPLLIGKDRYRPMPGHSGAASSIAAGSSSGISTASTAPAIPPPPPNNRRSRSPTPPQTQLLIFTAAGNTKTSAAIPATRCTSLGGYSLIPEQEAALLSLQTVSPTTAIPEANSIIANVQVHMVDTH